MAEVVVVILGCLDVWTGFAGRTKLAVNLHLERSAWLLAKEAGARSTQAGKRTQRLAF
jgi:hypothetical protein